MNKGIRIGIALGLAAMTLGVGIALAAGESAQITGYKVTGCTDSDTITIYSDALAGTEGDEYDIGVTNLRNSNQSGGIDVGFNSTYVLPLPTGTQAGDQLEIFTGVWDYGIWGYSDTDTLTFKCVGGQKKTELKSEPPYTGIHLINESDQALYQTVPNADGAFPCGVFNVNGWGTKYVGLADFPACSAPVAVMCLNGDLQWTADSVSDVVMQGDYEVDFTSSQHGVCALFNQ